MIEEYLKKHDPVERAKRQKIKGKLEAEIKTEPSLGKVDHTQSCNVHNDEPNGVLTRQKKGRKRQPLPAKTKHQVYLKAGGQCMAIDPSGKRCQSTRFTEVHHIHPVAAGGENDIENLILLCSGHHGVAHQ